MDQSICRVCAKKEETTESIFKEEGNMRYSFMIMQCVNVEIQEDDDLPKRICNQCVYELSVTYQFIKKCETTDSLLRSTDVASLAHDIKLEIEMKSDNLSNYADQIDELIYHSNDEDIKKVSKKKKNKLKNVKRPKMPPIPCSVCGLLVNSPSAMDIHVRTHTGQKPYSCEFCKASFQTKGSSKRHIERCHTQRERKFTCETCGNSFYTKSDIITHIRSHTGEKPYACPYCPNRFVQVASLIRHKRTHTGDKPYSCTICKKKFADKSLVNKHMSVHSSEKKYSCLLCSKAMKTKNSLRTHMAIHSNEKLNVCNFCGTAFLVKGNLKKHILQVHSDKSGQCSVCMKTFSDLEVHMRKHTGERPFACKLCNKAFASQRSLTCHVQFKHENTGKFKCSIGNCERTFPIASMLEFHLLKYHTNHTPYICQHCARGFYRSSDLSRHLRVTHAHEPAIQLKHSSS